MKNKKEKKEKKIIAIRLDLQGKDREALEVIKERFHFDMDSTAIRFLIRNYAARIRNTENINIFFAPENKSIN
jgi:hypothetical protein